MILTEERETRRRTYRGRLVYTSVGLAEEQCDWLDARGKRDRRSRAEVMRELVGEAMTREREREQRKKKRGEEPAE